MMVIWGLVKNIQQAIKKYGVENFKKEILFDFSTEEEMVSKEAELVNEEFLKRDDVYNIVLGGDLGWNNRRNIYHHEDFSKWGSIGQKRLQEKLKDENFKNEFYKRLSEINNSEKVSTKRNNAIRKWWKENGEHCYWKGKKRSSEWKQKVSEIYKKNNHQVGTKNSQYGKCWIANLSLKESIPIKKNELNQYIEQGWLIGRIYDFDLFFKKYNDAMTNKYAYHFIDLVGDLNKHKIPRMLKNKGKNLKLSLFLNK